MLNTTLKNVNDRISNRVDNIVSGLDLGLLPCLQGMRCFLHQVCFALRHGIDLHASGSGSKRYAYEPAPGVEDPVTNVAARVFDATCLGTDRCQTRSIYWLDPVSWLNPARTDR